MDNYIILSEKKWNKDLVEFGNSNFPNTVWTLIENNKMFTLSELNKINPKKIFVPHWSYKIPEEIFNKYECVLFHMTDLPFGRGGTPLQNLIYLGYNKTKISAIRVENGIDTGPVYLKKDLELNGSGREIFIRSNEVIKTMIFEIISENLKSTPQVGEPYFFKRRKKEDGNLDKTNSIEEFYNFIRMLDIDGYPPAYLEFGNFRLEFSRASLLEKEIIISDVRITKK
jgi:methionyl-tRNA formyltransferase